jgi:hypothetical protein
MKKHIKAITLMVTLGLSLMFYAPNVMAGDDPADCPLEMLTDVLVYNMKNKWFGGCKTKCGQMCDTDRAGEGFDPTFKL